MLPVLELLFVKKLFQLMIHFRLYSFELIRSIFDVYHLNMILTKVFTYSDSFILIFSKIVFLDTLKGLNTQQYFSFPRNKQIEKKSNKWFSKIAFVVFKFKFYLLNYCLRIKQFRCVLVFP